MADERTASPVCGKTLCAESDDYEEAMESIGLVVSNYFYGTEFVPQPNCEQRHDSIRLLHGSVAS